MLMSVEGLHIPDMRDATATEDDDMDTFIASAYNFRLKKHRRYKTPTE